MKIEIDISVPIPEGWKPKGEFRPARPGEVWLSGSDVARFSTSGPVLILERDYVMPDYLHRKLWNVFKPGTWFAWRENGDVSVGSNKLEWKTYGWQYNDGCVNIICSSNNLVIEMPDIHWKDSAMMLPLHPPIDLTAKIIAAAEIVVNTHERGRLSLPGDSCAILTLKEACENSRK